jgi:hypothetical protein
MAITLGTFTKQNDGSFTGTLKTLNVTANLVVVPVDKMSENARLSRLCRQRPALRGRRRLEPGRQVERRDLPEPQDRRAGIRPQLGARPPRQAGDADGGRHLAPRPVGAARALIPPTPEDPAGAHPAGLIFMHSALPDRRNPSGVGAGRADGLSVSIFPVCHPARRACKGSRAPSKMLRSARAPLRILAPPAPASRRLCRP